MQEIHTDFVQKFNLEFTHEKVPSSAIVALQLAAFTYAQSGTPSSKATAAYNTAVGCSITSTTAVPPCADIFSGAAKFVTPDN
jgi:hypothetical protein